MWSWGLACLLAATGARAQTGERWQVDAASGRLAFYPEVLRAIGASTAPASRPDADARLGVAFGASGRFELDAPGSIFRDVVGGSMRLSSRGVLRGPNGAIPLDGMELRRGDEERTLVFVGRDGHTWFEADHMHFAADRKRGLFRMFNLDVRLTTEAARVMGDVRYSELAVAVLELEFPVPELVGAVETPSGACTTPNWGLPHNDVALTAIGSVQQMAREATPPVRIAIAPSATLQNVGQTDVPWYSKFSGTFAPYNNDQHPFLVWNLYRVAGGTIEQIGVSPLKHAFLTVNSGCGCSSGNILWVGCSDTYGTGTNDGTGSLGPRSEILAYNGYWQRCQSIFDTNCDGVQNSAPPRANAMDRRMAVLESDLQTPGATYYIDSWYVVRDDVNIFNTMGWRIVNPVAPTPPATQWTFSLPGALAQGAVIDQWVNPAAPGANAQSVSIDTKFGRLRLAVRATDLGGGQWRYEYALMNFDFDPDVKSFSIPVPAGAVVTNVGFHDADLDGASDWSSSVGAGAVTWTAPNAASAQHYSTLYNFRFTVNAAPTAASGRVATLSVQAARGWQLQPSVLGPGTLTPLTTADRE
jgi:hypothetical protein